jgi:hypothetical protein
VFNKYQFDEKSLTGFHGYDIDYSLQVVSSFEVCVVFDVLLHHYSEGSFDKVWLENMIQLSKKWKEKLPFSVRKSSVEELTRQHWTAMNVFIEKMIDLGYKRYFIVIQLLKFSFNKFFRLRYFLYSVKLIMTYHTPQSLTTTIN